MTAIDVFSHAHPDAILVADAETGIFLDVNPAAEKAYGYDRASFCDIRLQDIGHASDAYPIEGQSDAVVRTHIRKNGQYWTVLVRQQALEFDGRDAVLLVVQDAATVARAIAGSGTHVWPNSGTSAEQEINLRIVQRLLKIGFWKYEVKKRKLIWSPSLYGMAGIEPHEFDGSVEQYISILYADDRERAMQAVRAMDDPEIDFLEFERRLVRRDGGIVYIKGAGERARTPEGDVITGVVQDVTTERVRDGQLRLLGASIEKLNDIVVILRVDPTLPRTDAPIVYINSAFERITGYSQKEVMGRPLSFILSFVEPRLDPQTIESAMGAGQTMRMELVGPVRSDKWVTWDVEFIPVADAHGEYSHLAAVARDITDRRLAERRAALSEDRFKLVSRSTADVVWEWDVIADTLTWSEAFDKLTGTPGAHLETGFGAWGRRIRVEDRDRVVASLREVVASPFSQSWSEEYSFVRDDSSMRSILDRGYVVRDENGRAVRMIGTMIDVTERRASEQRSRDSERLEAVGQLTGGVAHDFNNLLTVILGNADTLREQLEDPSQRRMAELVHLAASRGSDLTRRLLAFARRQPLKPQRVCLNERTGSVYALLRGALDARIRMRHVPGADLWSALVDPGQFDVAILNLAFNARDAMPEGGVLTIATENLRVRGRSGVEREGVPAGDYVCVSVTDTGGGMEEEALRRAFEPFFTTKPPGKGSGLGLSMVYGFAGQSDGHVLIHSRTGEGTSVRLFFPRAAAARASTTPHAETVVETPGTQSAGIVLIVEDDPLVREHAAQSFRTLGYTAVLAASSEEALSLLEGQADISLLFTDIILGEGMNGIELAAEASKRWPGLQVLFTSGYVPGVSGFQNLLDNDAQLLRKPYDRAELVRKLSHLTPRLASRF